MGFLRLIFENSFFPLCLKWFGILREKMCNRRLDCVVRKIMPAPDSFVLRNQTKLSFFCVHSPHRVPLSPGCTFILGKKQLHGKMAKFWIISISVLKCHHCSFEDKLTCWCMRFPLDVLSDWSGWRVRGWGVLYVPNLWFLLADPPFASYSLPIWLAFSRLGNKSCWM